MAFPQPPTDVSEAPPSYTEKPLPQEREIFYAYDSNTITHYVERLQPHHHIVEESALRELWPFKKVDKAFKENSKTWEKQVKRKEKKWGERERELLEEVERLKFRVKVEETEKELDAKFAELKKKW